MDAAPPGQRPRLPLPGAAADVLESLPPELLNAILSRLPLRDAVRTSALARAWRRRWQSVPSLKFEWDERANPGAVTCVLQRYSYPVREFRTQPSGRRRSAIPTAGSASWSLRGSKSSILISTGHIEVWSSTRWILPSSPAASSHLSIFEAVMSQPRPQASQGSQI